MFYTNCNKNKICGRGIFRKMFSFISAEKDSGTTCKCLRSSAHIRQQESTIFWSFSQSWYTLLQAVASYLWRGLCKRPWGRTKDYCMERCGAGVLQVTIRLAVKQVVDICELFHSSGNDALHVCACWLEAFLEWCWRDEYKPRVGFGTTAAPVYRLRSEFRMLPFSFLHLSEF